MKTYIIEWKFEGFQGEMVLEAKSAREVMSIMRKDYPGFEVDSFSVEVK